MVLHRDEISYEHQVNFVLDKLFYIVDTWKVFGELAYAAIHGSQGYILLQIVVYKPRIQMASDPKFFSTFQSFRKL